MAEFANLEDGGRQLGALLVDLWQQDPSALLAPVLPNGVPVTRGIDHALTVAGLDLVECSALAAHRSPDGVTIEVPMDHAGRSVVTGRTVVVIDDGVETGTVARAAAVALRAAGVARLVLAVPVCPREASADLQHRYDAVIAVARPLVRRDLTWHYADFDTIDDATARRLLAERRG